MRKNFLLTAFLFVLSFFAAAQSDTVINEKKGELKISGSADVYYKYDFAKTKENSFTSFTQTHNQFSLGMASVKFDYSIGKVGMVADLGFGQRAKDFAYNDKGIMQAIKQLYISYAPAGKLKFTAGSWATHIGYEVLDPQYNRNYSTGYLFTYGPFSHTGVKAEYNTGKHGAMLGLANPTDFRIVPDNGINKKFLLAQYSFTPTDAFKMYLNYAGGQNIDTSKSRQIDFVSTAKINGQFSFAVNVTYASVHLWNRTAHKNSSPKPWWGAALYLNYDPAEWFGLTLRSELFNDRHHLKALSTTTTGDKIFANTISANFKKGSLKFIPEVRWDHVNNKALFIDANHNVTTNDFNILFAAVYSF